MEPNATAEPILVGARATNPSADAAAPTSDPPTVSAAPATNARATNPSADAAAPAAIPQAHPAGKTSDRRPRRLLVNLARDTGYLALAFPFGLVAFTVEISGLMVGAATVILWVGLPLLAATLVAAHGFAEFDLLRLAAAGRDLRPERRILPRPAGGPGPRWLAWAGWLLSPLRDPMRWREAGYCLAALVVGTLTWSLGLILWCLTVFGLTAPIWEPITDRLAVLNPNVENQGLADFLGWPVPNWLVYLVIGLAAAVITPSALRGLTALHAEVARFLLLPSQEALTRRLAEVQRSRERAQSAEAQSLRRIERDIHDGPQQQLVRLSMDLGTAQRRLTANEPEAAQSVLTEARSRLDQAIGELRALTRGVAPPILHDRGLGAALSAAAPTLGVPTQVELAPPDFPRLPQAAETALYFAASELLANVAKHAGAHSARLSLSVPAAAGFAELSVHDDGHGGAVVIPGHGLAGLADRLAGVDGSVDITSSDSGTRAVVRVPLPRSQSDQ
ncbi:MAG: sensor domain-containing protein [Bifidobacteriaceae bacterium]|jgi:signal transduction histidine kinase|nr:sensor domain-containing protein [Bifidobacteriaceae bacterium]